MSENKLDVRKAFEAIAHIIGKRENVVIDCGIKGLYPI